MASYSDGLMGYADFRSAGRNFGWATAASVVVGAASLYVAGGRWPGVIRSSEDLMIAGMLGCIALGLSAVMGLAVAGSLMASQRAKTQ
ncbi:hypothetical protein ACPOL_2046 [Acidisarcina polymorpha]|uniref:Uncharacterized protein n=1 Tax=Acidisarcina polymorpha TaxID=2211140 RepID=A0A2Z5FX81_9BACT|nr:hypothetical protein [Acidisarcina polymorpha]AXC11382.1 hypothetical protein ACPOL_2046 [Acidisarcina polymorpha]